jgi:AraC-like DNA-binding protein
MGVLLDTRTLAPSERADAVAAAMRTAGVPASLTHQVPDGEVSALVEHWDLGSGRTLLRRRSSGIRLTRSPAQVRTGAHDRLALTLLGPGDWRFAQGDADRSARSTAWQAIVVDQAEPYEFLRPHEGSTVAFGIDRHDLDLPGDLVRRAAGQLDRSPLHAVVRQHVLELGRLADAIPGPATAMLGRATLDLVRAYLISAAGEHPEPVSPDSLLARSRLYIDAHLADRNLTAERVARAQAVSVRQLFAAWTGADQTLAEYVMRRRLETARRLLAQPSARHRSIAAIARSCGFADAAHFSRRFRREYGVSPREWRA